MPGRHERAKKNKQPILMARDLEVMAQMAGYTGEPLDVLNKILEVDPDKRPQLLLDFTQCVQFIYRHPNYTGQDVVNATMSSEIAGGKAMLALTDPTTLQEQDHSARFKKVFDSLFK